MADKKSAKTKKLGLRDPRNEVRRNSAENKKGKISEIGKKGDKKKEETKDDEGEEMLTESQLRSQLLAKQQELLQLQWKRIEMQLNIKQKQHTNADDDEEEEEEEGVSTKETSPDNTEEVKTSECLRQQARKKNMEVARSLLNKFKGAGINPLRNKPGAKSNNAGDNNDGEKKSKHVDKMLTSAKLKGFVIPKKNNNNKTNNKNNEKSANQKPIGSEDNNKNNNNKKRKNLDGMISDPRLKKQKKNKGADRSSLSPDIRDLFGNEDKDHRLKHKPLLPPPLPPQLSPQSPACTQASGWASFKASHPSNYTSNFHPLNHQYHNMAATDEAENVNDRSNDSKKRKALLPTPEIPVDQLNEDDKEKYSNRQMTEEQRLEHLRQMQVELVREKDRLQSMDGDVHTPMREFKRKVNMRRDLLDEEMLDMENPKWYNQNGAYNNPSLLPAPPKLKSNHYEGYRHRPHVRRDLSWDIHHDHDAFNKGDKYYNQEYDDYRGFQSRHPLPPPLPRPPYPPHSLMNDRFYDRKRFDDYEGGHFYGDYNGDEYFFDGNNGGFKGAGNQDNVPLAGENNPQFQSTNQDSNKDQSNTDVNSSNQSQTNNPAPNIDVQSLFSKLVEFGMIGGQPTKQPTSTNQTVESEVKELPDLTTFDVALLKKSYRPIVLFSQPSSSSSSSSSGKSFQCSSCGLTFPPRSSTGALINQRYKTHLDWHFNNKKQRLNGTRSRKPWKYALDWVQSKSFNPISYINSDKVSAENADEEDEDEDVSNKENPESQESKGDDDDDVIATLASKNADDRCQLCNDKFDYYWSDKKDAWLLSEAVVHEDRLLHRLCLPDYLQMISNNERSKEEEEAKSEKDNNDKSEVVINVINDSYDDNNKIADDVVLVDDDDDDDVKVCEQKTDETDNKIIDNNIDNDDNVHKVDDNIDQNNFINTVDSTLTTSTTTSTTTNDNNKTTTSDNNTLTVTTTTTTFDNNNDDNTTTTFDNNTTNTTTLPDDNFTPSFDEYNTVDNEYNNTSIKVITIVPDGDDP